MMRILASSFFVLAVACIGTITKAQAPTPSQNPAGPAAAPVFEPLQKWRAAVETGNVDALAALYDPRLPPELQKAGVKTNDPKDEVAFWMTFHKSGMKSVTLEDLQLASPREDIVQAEFQLLLTPAAGSRRPRLYVGVGHLWMKRGEGWKILLAQHTAESRLKQPTSPGNLYPADKDADAAVKEALEKSGRSGKRVLVVFGANWCYDCHVLEAAFHREEIAPVLNANFEVVHVDIGEGNKNLHLMQRYEVPLEKGIPAVAVLESNGKLVFSQKNGEFEPMRSLGPDDILGFLNRWKPNPSRK